MEIPFLCDFIPGYDTDTYLLIRYKFVVESKMQFQSNPNYNGETLVKKAEHEKDNNQWVTMNTDFLSRMKWFGNENHCWIASNVTTKMGIHGKPYIILFFACYILCNEHTMNTQIN